jgi:hypothetical protein
VPGCSKREATPFPLTEVGDNRLGIDLNHPLARFDLTLSARRREPAQSLQPLRAATPALSGLLTGNRARDADQ